MADDEVLRGEMRARLIAALHPGLELVARPFARLGERVGRELAAAPVTACWAPLGGHP